MNFIVWWELGFRYRLGLSTHKKHRDSNRASLGTACGSRFVLPSVSQVHNVELISERSVCTERLTERF